MSYCAYLRKSRKDIELENNTNEDTLARHEAILNELATKKDIVISKFYREIVSGDSIQSRPVMQELLNDIEKGLWQGVLVVEVERLARGDTADQGVVARSFKYSSTLIITPMKTYDPSNEYDEEYFEFGLFMSRREYKAIKRRMQAGRKQSTAEGKYIGSQSPYGYEKYKLKGEKGFSLRIVPEEAEIVKMIYRLYTYGEEQKDGTLKRLGSTLICKKLNEMGVVRRNAPSGLWTPPGLLYILKNPVYVGKLWWMHRPDIKKIENGKVVITRPINLDYAIYDARHEGIIDEKTWNDTQFALKNTNIVKVPNAFSVTSNALAGLVVCKKCGKIMVRRPYNSGGEDTLICTNNNCKNVSSLLKDVELDILNNLQSWLDDYRVNYSKYSPNGLNLDEQIKFKIAQKKLIIEDIDKANTQIDNLHDLLEQKVYDIETFRKRKSIITNKIETLKTNEKVLSDEINEIECNKTNIVEFIPKVENVLNTYHNIDSPIKKNELLKSVLIKVEYLKEKKGTKKYKAPFHIDLFPKFPVLDDYR